MTEPRFESLFDGVSLTGWSAIPRRYGQVYPGGPDVLDAPSRFPRDYQTHADAHPAAWSVEDGVIVGRQQPEGSGYGGYLISDRDYGDFELRLEANPDWPADTGIMVRRRRDSWEGLQVLLDHRQSGSIGGFYGNGIGGFHAVPFALDARRDPDGTPIGLQPDDPATSVEPFTPAKRAMLTKSADAEDFLAVWRWGDWNEFRIRCLGAKPCTTVWINDLLVAEIDLARLQAPHYQPDAVLAVLGSRGHIAFEVHDNDPTLGQDRWAPTARCRWRNIRIKELLARTSGSSAAPNADHTEIVFIEILHTAMCSAETRPASQVITEDLKAVDIKPDTLLLAATGIERTDGFASSKEAA